jgi:hypothetical protein
VAKIRFCGGPPVSPEGIEFNSVYSRSLGFPLAKKVPAHDRHLAIVGGGPSVKDYVEEIGAFKGDIWGINGACGFLRERGIESTFISVDPHEIVARWAKGATRALISVRVDPKVFEALNGAEIKLFELAQDKDGGVRCFSSTASLGFDLATDLGYRTVVWYGCEGSWEGSTAVSAGNKDDKTHAYPEPSEKRDERMVVLCQDGKEYLTAPDFYVQSCELAEIIRKFSRHFSERSGGLLRALVDKPEHDITKVSRALMAILQPVDPKALEV